MDARRIVAVFIGSLLLIGCRGTPSDSGFSDVQRLTSSRLHQTIRWNQNSADDRAVQAATTKLLNGELTVDQTVQIALLNNRSLQADYSGLGIAQSDLVQAGLLKNPIFFASSRFPDHAPHGPDVELSISQDFIDLLLIPAQKKIAAAKLEQVKLEISDDVFDLATKVKSAYYALAGDEQMLQMRRTAADAMQLSAQAAQKMSEAGNLNDLDLDSERVTAEEAKANLASAQSQVDEDRQKLIELMGIDSATAIQIPARLPDPADDPSIDQLGKLAQSRRLDLLAAKQAIRVAAKQARLSDDTRVIPQINLGADTERDPGGNRITGPTVTLPIPLFDQGQATAMRARAVLAQRQQEYFALAMRIGSQVRQALQKMSAARERAQMYRATIIPLRHRIVAQAQLHYNGMLLGIFQLLQAKQNEIDAGREYIAALRDYWVARCELERAVGGEIFTQPATQPTSKPTTGD